jgi:alpha-glucosidase
MAAVTDVEVPAPWWRDAVIYQLYVRSFADSDGDGLGDLAGARRHLRHIADLGVDAIWFNPFYPSPQADAGYDVSDHRDIDPRFGTLHDFDELLQEAHALGLRVLVDLVPNHTSDQHPWFQEALRAAPGSPARDRYLFRDGRGRNGDEPPNNWQSNFGGAAWTRAPGPDGEPGQWYLHLFAAEQPDLDWTSPDVLADFEATLRFWLDRGVDGFRVDVAHALHKAPGLPDATEAQMVAGPRLTGSPSWDQEGVHDVYRSWRRLSDSYDGERVFVAEAWLADPARLARYVRPDELHTAFNFNFLLAPWDAVALRTAIDATTSTLAEVGAPPSWVLSNHDVRREVTRYGGGEVGRRRARAAALLMFALPGGAYVYQGEELGLEDADLPDEARQDPTFFRTGGERPGRDGCRVPLPWSGDEPPFGFSSSPGTWLPQPASWRELTAERQESDEGSMLWLYRRALRLRRELALGEVPLEWVAASPDVLAFRRGQGFACVVNVGDEAAPVPPSLSGGRLLLASGPVDEAAVLPGATAVWLG